MAYINSNGTPSSYRKGKKNSLRTFILTVIMITVYTGIFTVNRTAAAPPQDGVWVISGVQQYKDTVYNAYFDIRITAGSNVTFENCRFNFVNMTSVVVFWIEANSSVYFYNCVFDASVGYGYISSDYNTSLVISDTEFREMGTPGYYAMELSSDSVVIENSVFGGTYSSVKVKGSALNNENLTVYNTTFNDYGARYRQAIFALDMDNVNISYSGFTGWAIAMEIRGITGDFVIKNNYITNTYLTGILVESAGKSGSGIISDNDVNNAVFAIMISQGYMINVRNNNITARYVGISVDSEESVFTDNSFFVGTPSSEFYAFELYDGTNNVFRGNMLNSDNNMSSIDFLVFKGSLFSNYTWDDNTFNGFSVITAICNVTGGGMEFNGYGNIFGGIYLFNTGNITFSDLTVENAGSAVISNCDNITFRNIDIIRPGASLRISGSSNIGFHNVGFKERIGTDTSDIVIESSSDIVFNDSDCIHFGNGRGKAGFELSNANNTLIQNGTISGYKYAVSAGNINSLKIINNNISSDYAVNLQNGSVNVNFTGNSVRSTASDFNKIIVGENPALRGNTFSGNHWSANLNITDNNGDGIGDSPFIIFDNGLFTVTDPFPLFIDSDGDGLDNFVETEKYGTDPLIDDTDGDGISDGDEIKGTTGYRTDPLRIDTDYDGISDYDEIYGTGGYTTDPLKRDTDGDGFTDYFEIYVSKTDPVNSSDYPGGALGGNPSPSGSEEIPPEEIKKTVDGPSPFMILVVITAVIFPIIRKFKKKYGCIKKGGMNR